jgi:hypothetical protein
MGRELAKYKSNRMRDADAGATKNPADSADLPDQSNEVAQAAGRLFDPGPKGPNPWALHPDNWLKRKDVVFHATDQERLPRNDRGPHLDVGYGDASGMHFGDKATAVERGLLAGRQFVHAARLTGPKTALLSDRDANYSGHADKAVREGKTVPYRNDYENPGAISYRALPETTKTWSQDVTQTPSAHPALQRLAATGYNPVMEPEEVHLTMLSNSKVKQPQLFAADVVQNGKSISHHVNEDDAFATVEAKKAKGQYGLGVKRNNLGGQGRLTEAAATAKPRLRRPGRD